MMTDPTSSTPANGRVAGLRPLPRDLLNSPRYPWSLIQLDYCAGVIPVKGICAKYGVSESRLKTIAARESWERRRITADDIYGPRTFGLHPHAPGSIPVTLDDVRKAAFEQSNRVVDSHKKDVARARAAYETILNRMLLALAGQPEILRDAHGEPILDDDGREQHLPYTGNRESPADILNKLTASLVRVVGLERQAYGLEVLGVNDVDAPNSEAESVKSELRALEDRLDSIAAGKAEPVPAAKDEKS